MYGWMVGWMDGEMDGWMRQELEPILLHYICTFFPLHLKCWLQSSHRVNAEVAEKSLSYPHYASPSPLPNPKGEASMPKTLTWTLFAAVSGVGTDRLSTGQPGTLHLLTVYLSSAPL
jgi:hypothetical protein